jgi:hypothetical protein
MMEQSNLAQLIAVDKAIEVKVEPTSSKRFYFPDQIVYTDKYLQTLDTKYPATEIFGELQPKIEKGDFYALNRFVMGSQLQSAELEDVLRYVIMGCAKQKSWKPVLVKVDSPGKNNSPVFTNAEEYMAYILEETRFPWNSPGLTIGASQQALSDYGLGYVAKDHYLIPVPIESYVAFLPSEKLIKFFQSKSPNK